MYKRVAELQAELDSAVLPKERLPILSLLSDCLIQADPKKGKEYAQEGLKLATSIQDKRWTAMAYVQLANATSALSNYTNARRYLRKAEKVLEKTPRNFVEKARMYISMGKLYTDHRGDARSALECYRLALEVAKKSNDQRVIANVLYFIADTSMWLGEDVLGALNECLEVCEREAFTDIAASAQLLLGSLYAKLGDWENAEHHYTTCLKVWQESGYKWQEAMVHSALGNFYAHQEQYVVALEHFQMAVDLYGEMGDKNRRALALISIGEIHIEQGNMEHAYSCAQEVVDVGKEVGNNVLSSFGLIVQGSAFLKEKKWNETIDVSLKALDINIDASLLHRQAYIVKMLATAYEELGNLSKALQFYKQSMELEQTIVSNEIRQKILTFPLQQQIEQIDAEKQALQTKALELEHETKRRMKEVQTLSLRVAQNDDLLGELKERLLSLQDVSSDTSSMIKGIVQHIDENTDQAKAWKTFERQLQSLDQEFTNSLAATYPSLTSAEMRICSLLKISLSNKEISSLLNVSDRTVDTHRTSIRKKMGLQRQDNLVAALAKI